jgi:two-component system, LytTR family, sensor kinase
MRERSGWLARAAIIVGGWTLFGLFFASQSYMGQVFRGREASWGPALLVWMACAFCWAVLTPGMLYMARRFPLRREGWPRTLAAHLLAALLFSPVALAIYVGVRRLLAFVEPAVAPQVPSFKHLLVAEFHASVITYGAVVCLAFTADYYRRYRERDLRAAQLESQLAQAQLDALRKQLQPHFLFNTLNTVSILIDEDTRAAREMLVRLSDLLRATLERGRAHEVTLRQELEFIEGYLEIERTRFQDRLTVTVEADPQTLDARVPDLILQPIVENAIRHGVAPRATAGRVGIRAERRNGSLRLRVQDDGCGLPKPAAANNPNGAGAADRSNAANGGGVGISNTRARLAQLYGAEHSFEMRDAEGGGLCVEITIPFRPTLRQPADGGGENRGGGE